MRAYIAGPYAAKALLAARAADVRLIGYEVQARWLTDDTGAPGAGGTVADRHAWATADLEDVAACDILVMFAPDACGIEGPAGTTGGRHVETGYALAHGKHVLIVGTPENVFSAARGVAVVADWHTAIVYLAKTLVDHHSGRASRAERVVLANRRAARDA